MSGLGAIAPQQRDLSRRRDRQAGVVMIGLVSVLLGFTDFDGGIFQS